MRISEDLLKTCSWSSLRKKPTFRDATLGFPAKWRLRNERRNSILMMRHYSDLGSAPDGSCRVGNFLQPMRSTTQIWIVTRHQHGIPTLDSQTSFCGETSGGVVKCWLFSQAIFDLNLIWILTEMMTLGLADTTENLDCFCFQLNLAQLNMAISKVLSKSVHWHFDQLSITYLW